MLKFRIHYTINEVDDYVDIVGEDIEEVHRKLEDIKILRPSAYDFWSEKIK